MQAPGMLTNANKALSVAIMQLGERIRRERQKHGWSTRELADRAKVSSAAVSLIETGKRETPGVKTIGAIADALGVTIDDLLRNEETQEEPAPEAS